MPIIVYDHTEEKYKQVAQVDTTTMLTLTDILPHTSAFSKKYLVKKEFAPKKQLRDIYGCRDNVALIRRIFNTFLKFPC